MGQAQMARPNPMWTTCPNCKTEIVTTTHKRISTFQCLVAACFCFICPCCFWIPYCIGDWKGWRTFQPRTFQPKASTPDLTTLDFSTMNFSIPKEKGTFQPQTFQPWTFQPQVWGWKILSWKVHGWKVQGWKVWGWKVRGGKVWGWSYGIKIQWQFGISD